MAIREGLCTNCGSLMRVNDNNDTITCIFCWGESQSDQAINLFQEQDNEYEFPNEEFEVPEAEEQSVALRAQGLGGGGQALTQTTKTKVPQQTSRKRNIERVGKLTPKEKVALQNKPIVKPEVSKRHKRGLIIGFSAFAIILIIVGIPTYFNRSSKENAIMEGMYQVVQLDDMENRVDITRQDNREVTVVSPVEVTEAEAIETFNKYVDLYAEVYGIGTAESESKVQLRLLDQVSGGFMVSMQEAGEVEAISLQKIIEEESSDTE